MMKTLRQSYRVLPAAGTFICIVLLFLVETTVAFSTSPQRHPASGRITKPRLSIHAAAGKSTSDHDNISSSDKKSSYLATCVPGLAHVLQRELEDMPYFATQEITNIYPSGNAAVTFEATRKASLYALCWLRSAHRLLELVAATTDSSLQTRDDIHDFIHREVNIKDLLGDGHGGLLTLSVKAILNNPRQLPKDLSHSHYTALTVKNALCDVVRNLRGDRPNVDIDNADVPLVCILKGEKENFSQNTATASLSLYRSLHPPGSLHKRGYRQGAAIHKAAMKESLAAGLLLEAGWKAQVDTVLRTSDKETGHNTNHLRLIDPMAGSGSLILEACMMATDIAPGLMRIRCGLDEHRMPPVTKWKSSDKDEDVEAMWKSVLLDATRRAKNGIQRMQQHPKMIQIMANDIHPGAIDIMESALSQAGFSDFVEIFNMDCYDLEVGDDPETSTLVATNPPWGVRLTEDIDESWEGLKHFIRNKCPSGTRVYVLSGDKSATATLKLKRDRMIPIQTGEQQLRWVQYTIRGNHEKEQESIDSGGSSIAETSTHLKSLGSKKEESVNFNGWG
jgi:putative N6-adenine-specific DNA methylase